jgi:integrase
LHLVPGLGRIPVQKLTPQQVAALLRAKLEAGLSPRTVHHIRTVLRTALNQAIRWELIGRNVAALTEPPRQTRREVVPFPANETRTVLAAAEATRFGALMRLAFMLGLREGEILGLRWVDVDLDAGTLRVRNALQRVDGRLILKPPKTVRSRRLLPLPVSVIAALKAHREQQVSERAAARARWHETGHVFTTSIGTPIDPRNLIRAWHGILSIAGVARRPFHTSRHTATSLLLAEGVPPKVVQEILGHSMLSTTTDTYGRLYPQALHEAADAIERALGNAGT